MAVGSSRKAMAARRNGAMSRGPVTPAGLARSSRNGLRHGLLAADVVVGLGGETVEGWEAHREEVLASLCPVDALEAELAERVASLTWRLRRVVRAETAVVRLATEGAEREAVADARPAHPADLLAESEDDGDRMTDLEETAGWTAARRQHVLRVGQARARDPSASLDPEDAVGWARAVEDYHRLLALHDGRAPLSLDSALPGWRSRVWTPESLTEAVGEALRLTPGEVTAGACAAMVEGETAEARLIDATRRLGHYRARALVPPTQRRDLIARYETHLARQLALALGTLSALRGMRG